MRSISRLCFYIFYASWFASHFAPLLFNPEQQVSYFLGSLGIFLAAFFIGRSALKRAFEVEVKTTTVNVEVHPGTDLEELKKKIREAHEGEK